MNIDVLNKPSIAERNYASDLNRRFDLLLPSSFMDDRKKVKRLIHGFGFHNHLDVAQQKYTGYYVEQTLRNAMENGLSIDEIQRRLNNRVSDIQYDEEDIYFLMEILTNSAHPPRPENLFLEGSALEQAAYEECEQSLYE